MLAAEKKKPDASLGDQAPGKQQGILALTLRGTVTRRGGCASLLRGMSFNMRSATKLQLLPFSEPAGPAR